MICAATAVFSTLIIDMFSRKKPLGSVVPTHEHLIDMRQVVKVYQTPAGPFTALKGVDLQVDAGEFVAVIGKSGSGKSTLINTLTGIDRPSHGEVNIGGVPIHTLNEDGMARWRGQNVGIIFQFFQLLPTLTLIENIILPMEFSRLYKPKERKERALHLLELVEMADHAYKLPSAISGGQQQRVAIARSLANDPALLIADEPTGSLDSKTADAIFRLFEELVAEGKTILMVTHDRDLASRVSRVVLIADGEIVDEYISEALHLLDEKQLAEISARLEPVTFAAGTTIFEQGAEADRFYIIVRGELEVVVTFPDGRQMVTAVLESGQYFGETGLLQNTPRTATVRVTSAQDAALMAMERDTFAQLIRENQLTNDAVASLMRQRLTTDKILAALPDANQTTLYGLGTEVKRQIYKPGAVIVQKGEAADHFYVIIRGDVEIVQPDQQDAVVARLSSGQYFGEIGLLRGGKRIATVRAALDENDEVEVVVIHRQTFLQIMEELQLSQKDIAAVMAHRLQEDSASG